MVSPVRRSLKRRMLENGDFSEPTFSPLKSSPTPAFRRVRSRHSLNLIQCSDSLELDSSTLETTLIPSSQPELKSSKSCEALQCGIPPVLAIQIPEIRDMIIDYLHDDKKSLATCSLVSRDWVHSGRYHLFHTLDIGGSPGEDDAFEEFLSSFLKQLDVFVRKFIRDVRLRHMVNPVCVSEPFAAQTSLDTIFRVARLLPDLQKLTLLGVTIEGCDVSSLLLCEDQSAASLGTIRELQLHKVNYMGCIPDLCAEFLQHFTAIKQFSITDCEEWVGTARDKGTPQEVISRMDIPTVARVESLVLSSRPYQLPYLFELARKALCRDSLRSLTLEKLSILGVDYVARLLHTAFPQLHALKLNLRNFPYQVVDLDSCKTILSRFQLGSFSQLEKLAFHMTIIPDTKRDHILERKQFQTIIGLLERTSRAIRTIQIFFSPPTVPNCLLPHHMKDSNVHICGRNFSAWYRALFAIDWTDFVHALRKEAFPSLKTVQFVGEAFILPPFGQEGRHLHVLDALSQELIRTHVGGLAERGVSVEFMDGSEVGI